MKGLVTVLGPVSMGPKCGKRNCETWKSGGFSRIRARAYVCSRSENHILRSGCGKVPPRRREAEIQPLPEPRPWNLIRGPS